MTARENPIEHVILVDENDREIGSCEKLEAHTQARLHRAFSIFLVDPAGRLLLQRRSLGKYHSGGLWANACCGHPRPGELTADAAVRRLREELGVTASLEHRLALRYRARVGAGMEENEIAHCYFGAAPRMLDLAPAEVMETRLQSLDGILDEIRVAGASFAPWFRHYLRTERDAIRAAIAREVNRPS